MKTSVLFSSMLFCFRADYAPPFKDKIMQGLRDLHLSPAGQQVLTIFHSEKLEVRPASAFQSAIDLLDRADKLRPASSPDPKGAAQ
ncbi:MAG: hypothetical protein U5R30_16465 [Deltaproteobacteria bacterium]|nr:hypothetical protein [Deltaproteobacteria bacterium]